MNFKMFIWLLYTVRFTIMVTCSQYTDDVDYNDIELYGNLSPDDKSPYNKINYENRNDFYISDEMINSKKFINIPQQTFNSDEVVEKIYRYTKHRIPGYDYDEFDFAENKNVPRCDDKSIWVHCLCQFTCNRPNTVDCYSPCDSGCECKGNYVFNEDTQQCIHPEHCRTNDDNNIL